MNKNWCNCCWCCCCENFKNDWNVNHDKECCKCCCCHEQKEFPKCECHKEKEAPKCDCYKEKKFPKCDCCKEKESNYSQKSYSNQNYDYGFMDKSKNESFCNCEKSNYGYNQNNFGW